MYSQHIDDFGLINIPLLLTLKRDAEIKKQRITKIPIHYREKIQTKRDEVETDEINERVGLDAAQNNALGSELITPILILRKGDTSKLLLLPDYLMQ